MMLGKQRSYIYGLYIVVITHLIAYNLSTVNLHKALVTISQKTKAKFKIKRAHCIITNRTRTCNLVRSKVAGKLEFYTPCLFNFDLETRFPPIRIRPPELSL